MNMAYDRYLYNLNEFHNSPLPPFFIKDHLNFLDEFAKKAWVLREINDSKFFHKSHESFKPKNDYFTEWQRYLHELLKCKDLLYQRALLSKKDLWRKFFKYLEVEH